MAGYGVLRNVQDPYDNDCLYKLEELYLAEAGAAKTIGELLSHLFELKRDMTRIY